MLWRVNGEVADSAFAMDRRTCHRVGFEVLYCEQGIEFIVSGWCMMSTFAEYSVRILIVARVEARR